MSDRLLSENEITKIVGWPSAFEYAKIVELSKSQLAKTDKEWVEWLENLQVGEYCHTAKCNYRLDCLNGIFTTACIKWQSRRKEIGI